MCAYFLQVEFYFGDSNLQKDRFLQQKMKEHPDGCTFVCILGAVTKVGRLYTTACVFHFSLFAWRLMRGHVSGSRH